MKAAIISVGTELTTGQILNRNATWISQELKALGLLTSLHLSIPDERSLIVDALDFAAERAELIFITGGLGPTSDDFTRELVSEWSGLALEFDPGSWTHLVERLQARNYPVKEIQRQQCYFPRGARILKNSQGTANAFILQVREKSLFVFPGPPREIAAIWNDFIQQEISQLARDLDRHQTVSWETIGLGESQIAERVEPLVKDSGFEIGYRVHMPYVEVKFSFFTSEKAQAQVYIERLENELGPLTLLKNGEDILPALLAQLSRLPQPLRIEIYDSLTAGILPQRCFLSAQQLLKNQSWLFSTNLPPACLAPASLPPPTLRLWIKGVSDTQAQVGLQYLTEQKQTLIEASAPLLERRLQIFTEYAMLFWYQELKKYFTS